jgi:hypothetical protein
LDDTIGDHIAEGDFAMLKVLTLAAACALIAGPAFAEAAAHPTGHAVRNACAEDTQRFCSDANGAGSVAKCLRQHHDEVSEECRTALANARAAHQGARQNQESDDDGQAPSGY